MPNQNAEQKARDLIDEQLRQCGWEVQDYAAINLAAPAFAVREFPMAKGFGKADYLLYINRRVVGVIEAKPEGTTLTGVEVQTEKYGEGLPPNLPAFTRPLPFLYQATGVETRFTNALDPEPQSRDIYAFHRPETLWEMLGQNLGAVTLNAAAESRSPYGIRSLLTRLQNMPPIDAEGMRDCQHQAVCNLEESLANNRRRSLIQMQTGSGKTYTAVAEAYRLIKYAGAKRVLFLVDRFNLAKQTLGEFQHYVTPDDGRKFTELYNVQWLQSNKIDPVAKVVITTIQRLYSILQGEEELDPTLEEESAISAFARFKKEPLPVKYNPQIPIETFDFVFTDECHRSIYNLWRQVLEYFDCYLIGLTATPSKQTLGFFHQNLVMEYGHAQAVADGVNVDFDVYKIDTRITKEGGLAEAGTIVDKRDRKSRKVRWEELDDDLDYTPSQLDRGVVVPDQIRTVVRTFKEKLFTEIFPGRTEVPKTLIFAKDDSHADDIVKIVREVFGKGNDFCQKITYRTTAARVIDTQTGEITYQQTGLTPESLLSAFRNSYNPRIAVTVDMIATGTDVKPLEIVFFMRDVLSANYFEQMKGRGCRVITSTEFRNVTPDGINKDRYVIIDAVGVTERERRQDSPPLEKQPGVALKTVLQAVGAGAIEPEVVSTLASRMARLDRVIGPGPKKQIEELAGSSISYLVKSLVASIDPDRVELEATLLASGNTPIPEHLNTASERLREEALKPFENPQLRQLILMAQQDSEQTIHTEARDEVTFAGASIEATEKARTTITDFRKFIEENRDELDALQILYSRPRGKAPTLRQLKQLAAAINLPPRSWTTEKIWTAYETLEKSKVKGHGGKMATDLVSLIRFALEQETVLAPFKETVEDRFAAWLASQSANRQPQTANSPFTAEQLKWLSMIKDHIAASLTIDQDDFALTPFDQEGGLGRAYQLFGEELPTLLQELNEVLAA